MSKVRHRHSLRLFALFAAFLAGAIVDTLLRTYGPPMPAGSAHLAAAPAPTVASEAARPVVSAGPVSTVGSSAGAVSAAPLRVPIDGVTIDSFKGGFAEHRGSRPHEAVDILAPRGTPIHAVQNGRITKLFLSKQGGITIYEFDPEERLCFYYAHLDRYADGLHEGQTVAQGDVIGFVGTTGNAPPNTPHLHFAVFELNADHHWWQGRPVDPYEVFSR